VNDLRISFWVLVKNCTHLSGRLPLRTLSLRFKAHQKTQVCPCQLQRSLKETKRGLSIREVNALLTSGGPQEIPATQQRNRVAKAVAFLTNLSTICVFWVIVVRTRASTLSYLFMMMPSSNWSKAIISVGMRNDE
jgi:hypothetical protein